MYPGGFTDFPTVSPIYGESPEYPDICRYHQAVIDDDETDGSPLRDFQWGPTRPHTDNTYWIKTLWPHPEYL
jgi:hypothetical protein